MKWYVFGTLEKYINESNNKIGRKNKLFQFFCKAGHQQEEQQPSKAQDPLEHKDQSARMKF